MFIYNRQNFNNCFTYAVSVKTLDLNTAVL